MYKAGIILSILALIVSLLAVIIVTQKAHADPSQLAGTLLAFNDPPLTGDLVVNGTAILVPELNQMLALERDGRAVVEITPMNYSYKCIDPINPCIIR